MIRSVFCKVSEIKMIKSIFLLPLASLLIAGVLSAPVPEDCKEKWAEQRLDHYR